MNLKFVRKNILFLFLFLSFLILGILVLTNYFSAKNLESDILNQYDDHRDLLLEKTALNIEKDITIQQCLKTEPVERTLPCVETIQ